MEEHNPPHWRHAIGGQRHDHWSIVRPPRRVMGVRACGSFGSSSEDVMCSSDPHHRGYIASSLLAVSVSFVLPADRTFGQGYTQTSQSRTMSADVTARVPGRPDETDVKTDQAADIGSFARSLAAEAMSALDDASVSVQGTADQAITFSPGRSTGCFVHGQSPTKQWDARRASFPITPSLRSASTTAHFRSS
jgi:hypothetical protein